MQAAECLWIQKIAMVLLPDSSLPRQMPTHLNVSDQPPKTSLHPKNIEIAKEGTHLVLLSSEVASLPVFKRSG